MSFSELFPGWFRRSVRTPTIFQMEALECGAASLAIVLAHHGRWVATEELRTACGISRDGTNAKHLLRAAREYGLEGRGYRVEPHQLRALDPPLILHWNFNHFLVLDGFLRGGKVRVNDPRTGPRVISEEELDLALTGVALAFEPSPDFRPGGDPPRLWRSLGRRLKESPQALGLILLASLGLVVPGLLFPTLVSSFIDSVLVTGTRAMALPLILVMLGLTLFAAGLTWYQRDNLLRAENGMAIRHAGRFLWHTLRLPVDFFSMRYAGDLTYRVTLNDSVASVVYRELAVNVLSAGMVFFFAALIWYYDPLLAVVGLLVLCLNAVALRWVSRRRVDGSRQLALEQSMLTGTALAGLQMIESVKASGSESDLFARWAGYQAKVLNIRQRLDRYTHVLQVAPAFLAALNTALLLSLGGWRVMRGDLTLGELVAVQILMAGLLVPVGRLVQLGGKVQQAAADLCRLDDTLSYPAELPEDLGLTPGPDLSPVPRRRGRLELDRVTFGYSAVAPPVVRAVSLVLEPGGRVAVVGRTGSGKSTLIKLVGGLYEPWEGRILLGGRPRGEWPRRELARTVAVVDQDFSVFPGSVLENLTLWNSAVPRSRVVAACRDACIHDDVVARPGGYESAMEAGGGNWSGGQLQRLEIARALVQDPALLVLDEATSALDPATEAAIMENLSARSCACLIVAHRLSTVREADEILVLEQGAVVERGTHPGLMAAAGRYADLVALE